MWILCYKILPSLFSYRGNKNQKSEVGLAFTVVKQLLEIGQYLKKGYTLFLNNFFMSIPLAQFLYENFTRVTRTLRKNRKGIPAQLKDKFNVGQKTYLRKDHLLVLGYCEKASQKILFCSFPLKM